jgi:hypothetical protein
MKIGKTKITVQSIYGKCRHRTKWSVRLRYPLRSLKRDMYSFLPSYKKYLNGAIIHVGMKHVYLVIDKRNINTVEDFVDEMTRPQSSYLLRKFR